ncbi:MAG: hypothetical protein M1819_003141 [Sarea resinae]|nr:MAG: hypothetical protein M1819_003141 [Sarea resinae]
MSPSPAPSLAPAGSSSYSSNTLHVGDGTWDSTRDDFLLPNLVGLNFETMRYNGMGNRFRDLPQYHALIRAHGVIAAITFLGILPAAIFLARFYDRQPRWALRLHIWLQILTVGLSTVVFVIGWFAVGPRRSLTNPHHGIGLALYVLILFQALYGWWVHGREKGKRILKIPLKLVLHQWLGRAIALLGIVQIPLGLTLYGSPVSLFVLYTLFTFALLVLYFILTYRRQPLIGYDGRGSYTSGSVSDTVEDRSSRRSRLGPLAAAGAAGAGIAAIRRHRSRSRTDSRPEVISSRPPSSRPPSGSYIEQEKYSESGRHGGRWKDWLLKGGAAVGGFALIKNLLERRKDKDRDSDTDHYHAPLGGPHSISDESISRLSRLEEGRPIPPVHSQPYLSTPMPSQSQSQFPSDVTSQVQPHLRPRRSYSESSLYSRPDYRPRPERKDEAHNLRDGLATLGAVGLVKEIFRKRREKKEQRRIEELRQQELEEERIARANSQRYTGDGFPNRVGRRGSLTTSTSFTETNDTLGSRPHQGMPAPVVAAGSSAGAAGAVPGTSQVHFADGGGPSTASILPGPGSLNPPPQPYPQSQTTGATLPPPPSGPPPAGTHHQDYGSDVSSGGRPHHLGADAAAAGVAAGAAAAEAGRRSDHSPSRADAVVSPPVAVNVKWHKDGRHVTLRRLSEQEAAAEREARRRDRHDKTRRNGAGAATGAAAASELSGVDPGERWRRTEAMERQQAEEMRIEAEQKAQQAAAAGLAPPPLSQPPPLQQPQQQTWPAQPQQPQQQYPPPPSGPPPQQRPQPPYPPSSAAAGYPPGLLPEQQPQPTYPSPSATAGYPPPDPPPPGHFSSPGSASIGSPGAHDGTNTEASADWASNRRRRRAERAQARQAAAARAAASASSGVGDVEFD